jgi:hypothetical protein
MGSPVSFLFEHDQIVNVPGFFTGSKAVKSNLILFANAQPERISCVVMKRTVSRSGMNETDAETGFKDAGKSFGSERIESGERLLAGAYNR